MGEESIMVRGEFDSEKNWQQLSSVSMKKTAFILWHSPWKNAQAIEIFDLVIAASGFENQWGLIVMGDGFFYGTQPQGKTEILRCGLPSLKALRYAERGEILLFQPSAHRFSSQLLSQWEQLPQARWVSASALRESIKTYDHIIGL